VDFSGIPVRMEPLETIISEKGTITVPYITNAIIALAIPLGTGRILRTNYEPGYFQHITLTVTPTSATTTSGANSR